MNLFKSRLVSARIVRIEAKRGSVSLIVAWDDAKYGRTSEHPYIEVVFPTVFERDLAPEGRHIALCFTQFGPYELRDGSWETEREAYGRKVVRTIAEYCPGFESSVEHMEVLAPPDSQVWDSFRG